MRVQGDGDAGAALGVAGQYLRPQRQEPVPGAALGGSNGQGAIVAGQVAPGVIAAIGASGAPGELQRRFSAMSTFPHAAERHGPRGLTLTAPGMQKPGGCIGPIEDASPGERAVGQEKADTGQAAGSTVELARRESSAPTTNRRATGFEFSTAPSTVIPRNGD